MWRPSLCGSVAGGGQECLAMVGGCVGVRGHHQAAHYSPPDLNTPGLVNSHTEQLINRVQSTKDKVQSTEHKVQSTEYRMKGWGNFEIVPIKRRSSSHQSLF